MNDDLKADPLTKGTLTNQAREILMILRMAPQTRLALDTYVRLKQHSTQRMLASHMRAWNSFIAARGKRWETATARDAVEYVASLKERPGRGPVRNTGASETMAPRSIVNQITSLSKIYERLQAEEHVTRNPFLLAKDDLPRAVEKRGTRCIPFALVPAMIESGRTKAERALLACLFGAALRRNEALDLRLSSLKRTQSGKAYLALGKTKGSKQADVAVSSAFLPYIEEQIAYRRSLGLPDTSHLLERRSETWVRTVFAAACEAVGLNPAEYTPHSARATTITKLLADGVEHRRVQAFSRHSSVTMVEVYDKRRLEVEDSAGNGLTFETNTDVKVK